jgi:hypothetical protein
MFVILSFALIVLAMFAGTALAADVATDPNTSELARQIYDAIVHGRWWVAASAGVILTCALARRYMPGTWKAGVKGDIIGMSTTFTMAFAGAVLTWAVAPGAVFSTGVLLTALKVGIFAIGGWGLLNKLLNALAAWSKTPAWLKPILSIVAALVGSSAALKIKQAEAAGDAAVGSSPPSGMAGSGKIREVE